MEAKRFYYSVDPISYAQRENWNARHTLQKDKEHSDEVREAALKEIPEHERIQWFLTDPIGIHGNEFYRVFIAFRVVDMLTPKGRKRSIGRVLKMIGVPFTYYKYVEGKPTPAESGPAGAFDIEKLKGGSHGL